MQMITETVIKKSKHYAYLVRLAKLFVDNAKISPKNLETIINLQNDYFEFLK